jgi:hypothetical protein
MKKYLSICLMASFTLIGLQVFANDSCQYSTAFKIGSTAVSAVPTTGASAPASTTLMAVPSNFGAVAAYSSTSTFEKQKKDCAMACLARLSTESTMNAPVGSGATGSIGMVYCKYIGTGLTEYQKWLKLDLTTVGF